MLDFTTIVSGPYCTRLLADLGAEVIKIEPPEGDFIRMQPPLRNGKSAYFAHLNCGKKSIAIDLRQPEAGELIRELAAKCRRSGREFAARRDAPAASRLRGRRKAQSANRLLLDLGFRAGWTVGVAQRVRADAPCGKRFRPGQSRRIKTASNVRSIPASMSATCLVAPKLSARFNPRCSRVSARAAAIILIYAMMDGYSGC